MSKRILENGIPLRLMMRSKNSAAISRESADEALMEAFKRGDKTAFGWLMDRHQKPLYGFIYKYLRQPEAAEEAFQEIFMRVIRSSGDYQPSAKFTTWLYTVARNFCIDQLRKGRFRQHISLEQKLDNSEDTPGLHERIASDAASADDHASAAQLESYLLAALAEMPEEQKDVYLLREFQGLKFEQIAKVTESSLNTVKSRMRYALKFLQKKFAGFGVVSGG